jgi:hypothetical protein
MSKPEPPAEPSADDEIRAAVMRLARPHPRGKVIERAAILAEGPASAAILEWILAHAGEPETTASSSSHGLHGGRDAASRGPQRYVLPAGAFS